MPQLLSVQNCTVLGARAFLFGFRNKAAFGSLSIAVGCTILYIGVSRAEHCMSSAKARTFDPKVFLAQTGLGRVILQYPKNKVIFAQGDPSDAVFYIQVGRAKLTVLSAHGK